MAETTTSQREQSGDLTHGLPGVTSSRSPHPASQFRGRGEYAIDDKGRLTLPAQMRKALADGGNLVVLDGRGVIWDELTYRDAVDQLNHLVGEHELTSAQVRSFLSNTHPVSPDSQGRIVVPHAVRIEAGLDRDVLVLGAGPRIEVLPAGADSLDAAMSVDDEVVDALDRARF